MKKLITLVTTQGKTKEEIIKEVKDRLIAKGILKKKKQAK